MKSTRNTTIKVPFDELKWWGLQHAQEENCFGRNKSLDRTWMLRNNVISEKAYGHAMVKYRDGIHRECVVDARHIAGLEKARVEADNMKEWAHAVKELRPSVKDERFRAALFFSTLTTEIIGKTTSSEFVDYCRIAGCDPGVMRQFALGKTKYVCYGNGYANTDIYKEEACPLPDGFIGNNMTALSKMLGRLATECQTDIVDANDAEQCMWEILLKYGGKIYKNGRAEEKNDEEIIAMIGGYLRSCIPTIRAKEWRECGKNRAYIDRDGFGERLQMPAKDLPTDEQAVLNLLLEDQAYLEQTARKYGISADTLKERLAQIA